MKTAKIAKVRFKQHIGTGRRRAYKWAEYTYLLPEGVDVSLGDTLVVPLGDYGHTRRAEVVSIDDLDYKYAIGKVVTFAAPE